MRVKITIIILVIGIVGIFAAYANGYFGNSNLENTSTKITYELNKENIEQKVHKLVNTERQKAGTLDLLYDERLSNIAEVHSQDMAERDYFDHYTPEGLDPTDRGKLIGYECVNDFGNYQKIGIAENIFSMSKFWPTYLIFEYDTDEIESEIAEKIVNGWMKSSGHRENILSSTNVREGIGLAMSEENSQLYVTQNFC